VSVPGRLPLVVPSSSSPISLSHPPPRILLPSNHPFFALLVVGEPTRSSGWKRGQKTRGIETETERRERDVPKGRPEYPGTACAAERRGKADGRDDFVDVLCCAVVPPPRVFADTWTRALRNATRERVHTLVSSLRR